MEKIGMIIEKYKSIETPVKASFWFIICSVLQKGIAFITLPIFTRLMSTEQFGMLSIYLSSSDLLSIFATLKLAAGVYNNGMVKYESDVDGFTSSLQMLTTILSLGLFIIFMFTYPIYQKLLGLPAYLIVIMFLEILFSSAYFFWSSRQRFEYKYKKLVLFTLFTSIISPLLGIYFVTHSKEKGVARILSIVIVNIVFYIIFYVYNFYKGKKFFVPEYWKFALKFNIPLVPHYLSMSILNQSDRLMINNICGMSQAGIYSMAYSVAMLMLIITNGINSSFIPYTYKCLKDKKYNMLADISDKVLIFLYGMVITVIALAPEIISILATHEYMEAIWIIPPVGVSVYFILLYSLFVNIEFYYEKTKYVMFVSCIGALINISLNQMLIAKLGYLAAGYTTFISYSIMTFLHYIYMKKTLKENMVIEEIYNMKFIICFSIVLTILSFCFIFMYNYSIVRYFFLIGIWFLLIYWFKRKMKQVSS